MFAIIDSLKKLLFFKITVIYLRYLIGFAFVFASVVKIKGQRFTSIPPTEPVGYIFEALYQSGFYWNFLGWSQLISGALLMSQRFSTLGVMIFLPVIANVFMITHSINFGSGTPIITALMLLGTIFLLLWDYKKWVILFLPDHRIKLDLTKDSEDKLMTDPVWTIAGFLFVVFTVLLHSTNGLSQPMIIGWVFIMLLTGVSAFILALYKYKKRNA